MDELQIAELIVTASAGPASGVVVALLCMLGGGWFLVKHLLPRQDKMLDEFVKESRANRKVFVDATEIMARRLDKVEHELEGIGDDIAHIRSRI